MKIPSQKSFLSKKRIYSILLILFLLLNVLIPKSVHGNLHQIAARVLIFSDKLIFAAGDVMRIYISVKASRVKADVADLHVILKDPNGNFFTYYQKSKWIVRDKFSCKVAAISLLNKQPGPYSWYIALCPPGNNPFNLRELFAVGHIDLFLLPNQGPSLSNKKQQYSPISEVLHPLLIAHAGGEFEGRTGQNSLEALNMNYLKGHRYFEIDFCWTFDDQLVLIHDWQWSLSKLFIDAKRQPSFEEFISMKMRHNMTQMSLDSLLEWLKKHPDARIITDVKKKNLQALKLIADKSQKLIKNFIPQIYHFSEFKIVKQIGFEKIILTLYRSPMSDESVIKFAMDNRPFAVTMPVRRAFRLSFSSELRRKGVCVYTHAINSIEVFNYLRENGVHGIYTDKILFEDLEK